MHEKSTYEEFRYTVSAKEKFKLERASERMSVREMYLEISGCENRENVCD